MPKVIFNNVECAVQVKRYVGPANLAIQLWSENGPEAKGTLNPDFLLPDGYVIVKDYNENEGMLDALVQAGIVSIVTGDDVLRLLGKN